ncbi:MAG: glycosyl transferase [Bacteroidales bacterium]|nr:glycosyl transferase [Bacteroidales bacterium]
MFKETLEIGSIIISGVSIMRHAYLIIAHNEFEVLRKLVAVLDDVRNDIYVHIDKKVSTLPEIKTRKSGLYVLDNRIDVRWGHYSQIETEMLLFETAQRNGPYDYYHLISGTHLPLRSQNEIHSFYIGMQGKNLFSNLWETNHHYQEILKVHRVNLFLRNYSSPIKLKAIISQWFWKASIAIQRVLGFSINDNVKFYWANNWCSLTEPAIDYLVKKKKTIRRRYRWSFCGDEFFVPTELMQSDLAGTVVSSEILLYGAIGRSNAAVLNLADYDDIVSSKCLFGRKFSAEHPQLVDSILNNIGD